MVLSPEERYILKANHQLITSYISLIFSLVIFGRKQKGIVIEPLRFSNVSAITSDIILKLKYKQMETRTSAGTKNHNCTCPSFEISPINIPQQSQWDIFFGLVCQSMHLELRNGLERVWNLLIKVVVLVNQDSQM